MGPQASSRDPFVGLRTDSGLTYTEYGNGDRELYEQSTDPDQLNNVHATADPALTLRLSRVGWPRW